MKAVQWVILSISILLLSGCSLFTSKDSQLLPQNAGTMSGSTNNVSKLSIRENGPLLTTNELSLYPVSPLLSGGAYADPEYLRIITLNGKTEMGGRLTDDNLVESFYSITAPITDITYEQPWTGSQIKALEICTPDACTTLDSSDIRTGLIEYFEKEYNYYVGPNYFLVRIFTEDTLYQQLLTVTYFDLENKLRSKYNGALRAKSDYDRTYQRKLDVCYNMDTENSIEREACIQKVKQENTITLQDACTYDSGAYDNYIAIVSTLGANTQTMSWLKEDNTVYYVAQHSDNHAYVGCENEDHIVSFNAYDCITKEATEILVYDNLESSRLNVCGVRLAGVLEDDKLVYATYSYEGPYCSVNEPYKIMDMKTKDINQIRIVPENIEIAQGETGYFATLDLEESRKLYTEISDIYNTTIGNANECGAGQYTISNVSGNTLEITWAFGYYMDKDQFDVYELTKKYTLIYSGWLSLQ